MRGPLLSAVALTALLVACGGESSSSTAPKRAQTAARPAPPPERLTLRQQVGQVVVLAFGGTGAPDYVRRALREDRVAGVILFGGNVASPGQLRGLTRSLQRAARGSCLVMTDQEGGPFHIVRWAPPDLPQAQQGSPAVAASQAGAAARALRGLGINVTLAPVADVGRPGSALAGRAYPGDARAVAANVRSAVRAYRGGRVGATAKHFPGLGSATANTDDAPTAVRLAGSDLTPFKAAMGAGVPLVMASHAVYENVDPGHIASQSPAILRDLLRRRLGYRGVVITDSLEAEAVTRRSPVEVAAQRSLLAGADLILMTGDGSFRPVSLGLMRRASRDAAFRARLRQAAGRVLALKRELGLTVPGRR